MRRSFANLPFPPQAALCAARLAMVLIAAAGLARAEQPLTDPLNPLEPAAPGAIVQPDAVEPLLADGAVPYGGYLGDGYYEDYQAPATRPVNWIGGPYLKAGPGGIIGGGIFDDADVAWTVSGGYRQPLGPQIGGDRFFLDAGGSYLSAYGETVRDTQNFIPLGNNLFLPITVSTTLKEVKRASAHAAIGWYWGPPMDNAGGDPQVRFATRIGGRVGHVRGEFEDATDFNISRGYGRTDTFGGVFAGTEAILLQRQYEALGNVQWTIDGEFANDWIDFGGFQKGSLGTASVMFGFMLSR
ncbi:MAG: hypothetical protein IT424_02495 [Pirellulales bacterium]|nr:hypothetical protein [Pirellulales bacterium]